MEQSVSTFVQPIRKLQISMSSPAIALQVDMPTDVDSRAYFTYLTARIANDFEVLRANVAAINEVTITATHELVDSLGVEMSERLARIETNLERLIESVNKIDAKLDLMANDVANEKATNAVINQGVVEINGKLDKKASKEEVARLISEATLKQVIWTFALLLTIGGILYKILS